MSRVLYTPSEPKILKQISNRNNKRLILLILVGLAIITLISGVIYFIRKPYLRIKRIEFTGIMVLNEDILRKAMEDHISGYYAFILPKDSYLAVRTSDISSWLTKQYPRIDTIKVSKSPKTLKIEITERKLFGIACKNQEQLSDPTIPSLPKECYFIDKNGVAYEQAPDSVGSLITKIDMDWDTAEVGQQLIDTRLIEKIKDVSTESLQLTGSTMNSYYLSKQNSEEIRGSNSDGYKVYLNQGDDFKKVFGILKTVLDKEVKDKKAGLEYVDLRFGNKVFYKLKSVISLTSNTKSGTTTPKN